MPLQCVPRPHETHSAFASFLHQVLFPPGTMLTVKKEFAAKYRSSGPAPAPGADLTTPAPAPRRLERITSFRWPPGDTKELNGDGEYVAYIDIPVTPCFVSCDRS